MSTRDKAAALKHSHIHLPTTRGLTEWLKKPLAKEIKIDVALTALCFFILGWTFFSLVNAFQSCHVIQ